MNKNNFQKIISDNLRASAMLLALAIIWLCFEIAIGGTFLTARNLSNLAR